MRPMMVPKPPPAAVSTNWRQRAYQGFLRERTPRAQALEEWSVAWCVPCSLLAIAAASGFGALAVPAAVFPPRALLPPAVLLATALAWGFYGPIFFSLPWIGDPYTAGYWLPRLVLPGLTTFLVLGFVLVEFALRRTPFSPRVRTALEYGLLAHTAVACGLFAGFLA